MSSTQFFSTHTSLLSKPSPLLSPLLPKPLLIVRSSAVSSPEKRKKTRRRKPQHQLSRGDDSSSSSAFALASASAAEKSLRFIFMEELMERARDRDSLAVSQVIYDMIAAGLTPGPRSFHALIVSHTLNADHEAAVCIATISISC